MKYQLDTRWIHCSEVFVIEFTICDCCSLDFKQLALVSFYICVNLSVHVCVLINFFIVRYFKLLLLLSAQDLIHR